MNKLIEKCRLTDEECEDVENKERENLQWCKPILDAQLTKAIPIIRAEERNTVKSEICDAGYLVRDAKYGHGYLITDALWGKIFSQVRKVK